jgi:hypothetical protein
MCIYHFFFISFLCVGLTNNQTCASNRRGSRCHAIRVMGGGWYLVWVPCEFLAIGCPRYRPARWIGAFWLGGLTNRSLVPHGRSRALTFDQRFVSS